MRFARVLAVSFLAGLIVVPAAVAGNLSFPLQLPAGRMTVESSDGAVSIRILDPDYVVLQDDGSPALPYRVVRVLLPQGEGVASFRVVAGADRVIAPSDKIELAGPAVSEDGKLARPAATVTARNGEFPSERVSLISTGTLHGYTIASFAVYPVRVVGDDVIATDELTLQIETAPEARPGTALLQRLAPQVRARAQSELAQIVINPIDASRYAFTERPVVRKPGGFQPTSFPSLEGSPVEYVIITPDSLASTYQGLADFKTLKGVPTVVRTTEWINAHYRNGSDIQETIRHFVIDAYTKWGITYVCLGGDTEQIPPRFAWSAFFEGGQNHPVDMYFGCLDGDWNADHDDVFGEMTDNVDLYQEVYTGRIPSMSVAEAAMMIGKIITYETPTVKTFGKRVLLLGEVLFPLSWSPPQPVTLNGADLTEFIRNQYMTDPALNVVRMYETQELFPGSVDENRLAVIDSLDNGFNHVVHVGHGFRFNMSVGDVSLVNSDADALTNGARQSCLYFLNCTGAAYNYACIAEHFLRNPNGGAVNVIGANNSAFPNASQFYMNEYYRLLFRPSNPVYHSGEVFARSRLPRTFLAGQGDFIDRWTHYIYTLLGDPEMPLWTSGVTTLTLTHVPAVAVGTNNITVTVTQGTFPAVSPVDSAIVCLSKGDDDYQVGITDANGDVTLPFRAESAGTISVVATKRNCARKSATISVTNAIAYVKIDGMTIDDDGAGGTVGNGNGVIEGGETVDLGFTLRNSGLVPTGTVSVVLQSSDPAVTIVDGTASGGIIAAGGTGALTGGCRVSFAANTSDEHNASFDLEIYNTGIPTWTDTFKKLIHQPAIDLVKLRIDDVGTGNGNGIVEAGEQFRLFYKVKNYGTGTFPGGNLTVSDVDGAFTLIDTADTYGAAAPLAEAENTAGLDMVEATVATSHRLAISIVDFEGRAHVDTVELRPPVAPTALIIDPSLGVDRLRVSWTKSVSTDAARYNIYRAVAPGGPYTLANPDPVPHALYVDDGLNPNTLYYFRVTTLDASGNESLVSTTSSGSTNPPQLTGWPIALEAETASSPAVGDIDGNGDLEIVVCADKVYAWHDNGIELVDGDNDAQTWGLLSTQGQSFVSHPALARLDLLPGLEIIAASRDTKQVFVFKANGTVMTGWPRTLENSIRAGVVAGDLDNDGIFEVIAVDEKGVIYVWRADGTELIDGDSNPVTQGVFYRMTGCTLNYSTPAVANLDGDPSNELVVGSQGDQLFVFNSNGTINTGFPYALTSDIAGSPAIGDVDANGDLEIVVSEWGGAFRVLNHDATQQVFQFFTNQLFFGPSPAIGNVTGDAKLEMFIPSKNGRIYGLTSVGNFLPGWPIFYNTTGGYTESSPIIGDFDGDGVPDIAIADESRFLRAFTVAGVPVAGFPLQTGDAMRAVPTITDVDGDGQVNLITAGWDENVYVWDFNGTWNAANAPWPRFHANLHNNGRLGFVVPTPVLGAQFVFTLGDERIHLDWLVPAEAGRVFTVDRAEVTGGTTGAFHTIARGVEASTDGRVLLTDKGVEMGGRYVYKLTGDPGVIHETNGLYVPVSRAELGQNFPNPFNPTTKIEYWVPEGTRAGDRAGVNLVVYDVRGARVRTLVSGPKGAGRYVAEWDGRDDAGSPVSSGVYFYRMTAGSFSAVRKMVLLK